MAYILIPHTGHKKQKVTINPKNTDNKCFQYAATVAINYEEIESHSEKISIIKSFINKYKWKGINYLLKIEEKTNSNCEKQIILLMLSTDERKVWHYLAIKNYQHYYMQYLQNIRVVFLA